VTGAEVIIENCFPSVGEYYPRPKADDVSQYSYLFRYTSRYQGTCVLYRNIFFAGIGTHRTQAFCDDI